MNESATMHDSLIALNAELAQALGEAIWAFSMVERLTYRYLKILSQEGLDELLADQALKVRIRVIRQLLGRVQGRDKIVADVERCLDRAEKLAATRNLLAHNPWQVWVDFEQSALRSAVRKVTNESKSLDLVMVRNFRDEAGELASTFDYLLGQIH